MTKRLRICEVREVLPRRKREKEDTEEIWTSFAESDF